MPNILVVLKKAYQYTQDHKQLWFFGFFLTAGWIFSILRLVSFNPAPEVEPKLRYIHPDLHDIMTHISNPRSGTMILFIGITLAAIFFILINAFAKVIVMRSTILLEHNEKPLLGKIINTEEKYIWRITAANLLAQVVGFFILMWISTPVLLVFSNGYIFRGVFLLSFATVIYFPIFMILTLVNIFSCAFILAYDFSILKAIKSSFDLLAHYWLSSILLFLLVFCVYILVLIISASIIGLAAILAYSLSDLLKSISVPLYWIVNGLIIAGFSFILIAVNSILNIFTTNSWIIFFLEIVKGNELPKEQIIAAQRTTL